VSFMENKKIQEWKDKIDATNTKKTWLDCGDLLRPVIHVS